MKMKLTKFPTQGMEDKHVLFVILYCQSCSVHAASEAMGIEPAEGAKFMRRDDVQMAISYRLRDRYNDEINPDWVLTQLVENHHLARQKGQINASNTALKLIGTFGGIDAFVPEKILMASDESKVERLLRGRQRVSQIKSDEPSFIK